MLTEDFNKTLETYIKENKGLRNASKQSQLDLVKLGKPFGGRFNIGKLYFFKYDTPDEIWYDRNPIVLGLGLSDQGNQLGINLHYMPYKIRVEFIKRIYTTFYAFIKRELSGRGLGNPLLQKPISQLNWDNILSAYGSFVNLNYITKQYKLDRIYEPLVIGYEHWHIGVLNDENFFYGTDIKIVQSKYFSKYINQ